MTASNSRLTLDVARAGASEEIGVPELVVEETCRVMERIYGRRVVFSTRNFLLRLCSLIPRDSRMRDELERARGLVPEKVLKCWRLFE